MSTLVVSLFLFLQPISSMDCVPMGELVSKIEQDFQQGRLDTAPFAADKGLSCSGASIDQRIMLHLRLADIHDRLGLHNNSRPAAAALQHIETAVGLLQEASEASRAAVSLAQARYFYRAESADSNFPEARRFSELALARFEALGDLHGQADAVHLFGLFHLQREELSLAEQYFERSLVLEKQAATARPALIADYERHMGFVHQASSDWDAAITHFDRSFVIRRDNGLTDQAMFAAISLARALVSANRAAGALAPLEFALQTASKLNSAEAQARAGLILGDLYRTSGDREAAIDAYKEALRAATTIQRTAIIDRVGAELDKLLSAP